MREQAVFGPGFDSRRLHSVRCPPGGGTSQRLVIASPVLRRASVQARSIPGASTETSGPSQPPCTLERPALPHPFEGLCLAGEAKETTMKVSKTSLAILACTSVAVLTGPSALAQSEPWWNGAPGAPPQSAPAQKAAAPQAPAPPLPALPAPQTPAPPMPAPPQTSGPQTPVAQPPATTVTAAQPPSQPPPQTEPRAYPAPPQGAGQMATQGEWVYTAQNGWIWVPRGSTATTVGVEPYAYLYVPSYGWGWFASPWGLGPFHYGPWGWGPRWGVRYAPPGWGGIRGYGGRGYFGAGRGYGGFRGGGGHGGGHR
jgi:hypothetical protein